MTTAEIALALDAEDESPRAPHGGQIMDAAELEEYARKWRAMTPRQRLERARNKR